MKHLILVISILSLNFSYSQSFEWLRQVQGNKSDKASTVAVDSEGNIYFTGYYNEQAQFGPFDTGFSYDYSKETFVAKMDLGVAKNLFHITASTSTVWFTTLLVH